MYLIPRRFFIFLEWIVFANNDTCWHIQKRKEYRIGTRSRKHKYLSKLQTTLENVKVTKRRSSGSDSVNDAGEYIK